MLDDVRAANNVVNAASVCSDVICLVMHLRRVSAAQTKQYNQASLNYIIRGT